MTDTTSRALRALELLQSAEQRTVTELAERLGADERTVRRDIARLREIGIRIDSVRGRYGGYRLAAGDRVLPLMFSAEEVTAVILGVRAQSAGLEPDLAVQTALAKMSRALPTADADRVDSLVAALPETSGAVAKAPDPAVMLTLAESVAHGVAVDLRYMNAEGSATRRVVHPHDLVAHSGRWYLLALDPDAGEERTFRVDRIRTARATPHVFDPHRGTGANDRLLDHFADADYRWRVVLRIRQTEDRIRAQLPRSVARLAPIDVSDAPGSPWYLAEINAVSLDWLPSVIVALDCEVIVEQPEELRDRIRLAAERLLHATDDGGAPPPH